MIYCKPSRIFLAKSTYNNPTTKTFDVGLVSSIIMFLSQNELGGLNAISQIVHDGCLRTEKRHYKSNILNSSNLEEKKIVPAIWTPKTQGTDSLVMTTRLASTVLLKSFLSTITY